MAAVSYTCGGQRPLSAWFNNRLTILDRVLPHEGKSRRLRDAVRSELRARIEGRLADLNKAEVITKGLRTTLAALAAELSNGRQASQHYA